MLIKRIIILLQVSVAVLCLLSGCTKKDGTEKLCDFLFSDGYEAEFDYSFSGQEELSGSAAVKKSGKVRIDFRSPDIFSSLSVESDENGDPGVLIFNYYGMRAPLPGGALSKISLLLSFFSDEMPKGILSESAKVCRYVGDDSDDRRPLKECSFNRADGTLVSVIFDASDGFPVSFCADSGEMRVQISFTKIIPSDSVSSESGR